MAKRWKSTDPYPQAGTFGDLLNWHLVVWWTAPTASKTRRGPPRPIRNFATAIHVGLPLGKDENSPERKLLNWRNGPDLPDPKIELRIFEELFGDNPKLADWKRDLQEALDREREAKAQRSAKHDRKAEAEQANPWAEAQASGQRHAHAGAEWPRLSPCAAQLADCMSDISEKCWYAGWLNGLEYILWDAIKTGPKPWGHGNITAGQIELLRILSDACQGWIVSNEDSPPHADHQQWVPMAQWKSHVADPEGHPLNGKLFYDPEHEGQRRLVYGFVDDALRSSWKREALFFDRIVLPHFTTSLDWDEWHWNGQHYWGDDKPADEANRIILNLVRNRVIVPSTITRFSQGQVEEAIEAELGRQENNSIEFEKLAARLQSLKFARTHGVEAYPIYQSLRSFSADLGPQREAVLRVVFGRVPMPGPDVSWEQIIGYREDPESQRRFAALRVWVNRAVSGRVPTHEVVDELEHLTAEFEAHMRRHRVQFELTPFETVIAEAPETIAEMSALYGESAGNPDIAMFAASSAMFPEWELAAPGKELAYVSVTKALFSER